MFQRAPQFGNLSAQFVGIKYADPLPPETPVTLSAIVTLHEKTADGHRIESLGPAWREIYRILSEGGMDALMRHLDSRQFEELVAARYDAEGWDEVILTPRSGDGGKDVIAIKHGFASVRLFDQVKAYRHPHLVTAEEVNALLGVVLSDPKVTRGVVTTTSGFAPRINEHPSIAANQPFKLDLVDGPALTDALLRLGKSA